MKSKFHTAEADGCYAFGLLGNRELSNLTATVLENYRFFLNLRALNYCLKKRILSDPLNNYSTWRRVFL
jgi:hypothetical protein